MLLTLERIPRAEPYPRSLSTNSFDNRVNSLQCKSSAVFDASTVCVGPLVADVLEELIDEIPVGSMKLYTVESGFDSVGRCSSVQGMIFLDFGNREWSGWR